MQTELRLRRTQKGQVLVAMVIALVLPIMWQYLFQNVTIVIILTLMSMVLMLAIGLLSKDPTAPIYNNTRKNQSRHANDNESLIEEDLSNPADLWIWPVEPHEVGPDPVDLHALDIDNTDQMMVWLENLMIQEDIALQNSLQMSGAQNNHKRQLLKRTSSPNKTDSVLFMILTSMLVALALLWLRTSS